MLCIVSSSNMLSLEQFQQLEQLLSQLSEYDRENLLQILHSPTNGRMQQFNSDQTQGIQVEVNDGKVQIGDIHNHIHTNFEQSDLDEALRRIFSDLVSFLTFSNHRQDESANFVGYDENAYESQYTCEADYAVENYTDSYSDEYSSGYTEDENSNLYDEDEYETGDYMDNYSEEYSDSSSDGSLGPILMFVLAILGLGLFLSGVGNKIAVLKTPIQDAPTLPTTATVQQFANLRPEPDAGNPIGTLDKGQKVRVVRCSDNRTSCEVISGNVRGWIWKPYLRWD
jgi:hypothetical protein